MGVYRFLVFLFVTLVILSTENMAAAQKVQAPGKPSYSLLNRLIHAPQQVSVHQFSSHNKKGLNGQYAGTWYHGCHNPHLRWYDSDFDIHPDFTRGKTHLQVKLVLSKDKNAAEFSDFSYTVFSFQN